MPERAASLRPSGRLGLLLACAISALCVPAVAEPAARPSQPTQAPPARTPGPGGLWSRFPLAERPAAGRPAAGRPAAREARDGAREVAFVPSPPTLESATGLQPYLVAAFGVSVFATALLLAVVAVSASRTATYHRFLATRGTRPLATPPPAPERGPPARRHLALVPTDDGYTLVELEGDPPRVGTRLSGSDFSVRGRFTVSKVGPSPLPADDRRCAYLERV